MKLLRRISLNLWIAIAAVIALVAFGLAGEATHDDDLVAGIVQQSGARDDPGAVPLTENWTLMD